MSSPAMTQDGLKKLTVAQLKLICKEKRISGYSKLSKDPLVEKLMQWQTKQPTTTAPISPPQPATVTTSDPSTGILTTSVTLEPPVHASKPLSVPVQLNAESPITSSPRRMPPPSIIPSTSLKPAATSEKKPEKIFETPASQTASTTGTKRSASCLDPTATPPAKKRSLTNSKLLKPSTTGMKKARQESGQVTAFPSAATPGRSVGEGERDSNAAKRPVSQDTPSLPKSKPFKTLLPVQRPVQATLTGRSKEASEGIRSPQKVLPGSLAGIDLDDAPFTITLGLISLPASISQRKLVTRLAIILGGISSKDLKKCSLVSKAFRYAAYLSAKNQLSRKFGGNRLDAFLVKYPSPAINFWPYLVHREREANKRKRIYASSFLADTLQGKCVISDRLWSNPDNSKQAAVVARFLLTKMFFFVSVGAPESDRANVHTIVDLQEVIPDEIWRISVHSSTLKLTSELYVLESTCEVVGSPPNTKDGKSSDLHLRADWSSYVSHRLQGTVGSVRTTKTTIFDHLHWSNHEEYTHGISRLWLTRVQTEGPEGLTKLAVAKRYIMASVVANSISGRWMSSTAMQQDFNGFTSLTTEGRQPKVTKLNLFVPAHHHIESVHFETSKKLPLHSAIAVVQTPGREYYILRDNGMQIGCEEEGVAEVWMNLLRCRSNGRPHE